MNSKITIKKIQDLLLQGMGTSFVDDDTSRRMWWASLEVIQKEYLSNNYQKGGVWVASPLPALNEKKYFKQLKGWLLSPEGFPYFQQNNAAFLPVTHSRKSKGDFDYAKNFKILNLDPKDGYEPFLMIITPEFQCILTIAGEKDKKILLMRCDEDSLRTVIELIHKKFSQENYEEGLDFRNAINDIGDLNFNYQFSKNFWPSLSVKLSRLISNLNSHYPINNENKTVQLTEAKLF